MLNRGALLRLAFGTAAIGALLLSSIRAQSADGQPMTVEQFLAWAPKGDLALKVYLRGNITAFLGRDAYYVQDGTAGVMVYQMNAEEQVALNDEVEVAGTIGRGGLKPYVTGRTTRKIGSGSPPAPLDLIATNSPDPDADGKIVRLRTRVADVNAAQPEGRQIMVRAFGAPMAVSFEGREDGSRWPTLATGDLVEVTGVLVTRAGNPPPGNSRWRLIARSRTDALRLGGPPPSQSDRKAYWMSGAGVAVAGLVFGTVAWRRRRARRAGTISVGPALPQSKPSTIMKLPPSRNDMERRYQELFESATDIILTHDLDGQITSFNPAGERLLGWPATEVIGRPIYSILAPAEAEVAGGLVKGGRSESTGAGSFRLEFKTSDGRTAPFEVNSWIEYQDGEPVGVQAICRDISQRLRLEDERIRFERRLQDTQKLESLGILAGGIAHDFNNLLTAVLGNASLARIELPADSPTQKSLEEIELAAERASELCSQMLAYSGQGRFVVSRVNLSTLVIETLELIQASVSKRAKLELQLDEKLPAVHGDSIQLRQVLLNLVTNASEALGEGHGTVSVRTSLLSADPKWLIDAQLVPETFEGEYVLLEVTDTGCGMNPETAARIFEPFFTTKFTGRGLGLPSVLGIVRSHRGALKVQTAVGQGTKLSIMLPAIGVLGSGSDAEMENRPLFQATVLVVDDEASVRRTVTRVLETMGCKVLVAEDGTVALERLRQYSRPIDLVLLDLTMPQMDGVQTLRELRRLRPELPVILMSGFAQVQAMARFNQHRLSGFLQKPFKLDELTTLLRQVLTEQQGLFANLGA